MADKRKKHPLVRPGEPSEKTPKGLEVPIPKREQFFSNLKKVAKSAPSRTKGSSKQ